MNRIRVAELNIEIKYQYDRMVKQAEAYKAEFEKPDIKINISDEELEKLHNENPHLTIDECEYVFTGSAFYHNIIAYDAMLLHSSAVVLDNKAYLFSANSGTGKSTHTELWQEYFGKDRALILNDDKPVIRYVEGKYYAYGAPWSGKTDFNLNMKVPIEGIIFLERSQDNWIKRIDAKEALPLILNQTIRPTEMNRTVKLLDLLDGLLKNVNVYKLGCNISKEAVEVCYNGLK